MRKAHNFRKNKNKKTKQRKKLGQIFLKDENTLKKIVSLIDKKETDFVLEIGAGSGTLTEKTKVRQTSIGCGNRSKLGKNTARKIFVSQKF